MDTERYKLILDVATEGFWDWDLKNDRVYLSPRYCELIGYSPDDTVFDSAFLKQIIHPDDHQHVFSVIDEHLQGKREISVNEYRLVSSNGTIRWIGCRGRVVEFDELGRPSRMVGTVVDITDRKLVERELSDNSNFLADMIEYSGMLIAVKTLEGRYVTVNRRWEQVTGLSRHEVLGRSDEEIFPDPFGRELRTNDLEAMESGRCIEKEEMIEDAESRRRYGISTKFPLKNKDGSIRGVCVMSTDITDRKLAELRLQKSEEEFRLTFEGASDAIFWADASTGILTNCNKAAEDMMEIPREEIIGKHQTWLHPPEMADHFAAQFKKTAAISDPVDNVEAIVLSNSGRRIPVQIKHAVTSVGGREIMQGVFRDISEQRQAEEVRIKLEQQLLHAQKLESLGVLAGGIAHDFNNILTGIIGNISYARRFLDESHKAAVPLLMAEKAVNRATDLSNQLLTFAKGGQPIKQVVLVKHLLNESASFVLRGSNVSCDIEIPDDVFTVEVDEGQISQVLNNIIINALQAMPGGGTITIRGENVTVDAANIHSLASGDYVRLTITDTGCGISAEDQGRIFDPYFTTKNGGSGLGLASAYSIIFKHGGYIGVHSVVGEGATFEILLPACYMKGTCNDTAPSPAASDGLGGFSVLVMDDEEMIRELTQLMLYDLGHHVQTCVNGEEAIALYTAAMDVGMPYSTVIMDLTIPGAMGGKDAAQRILAIDPHARLIVSSGYSSDTVMAEYTKFGFCAMLKKPYDIDEISRALGTVLSASDKK